MEIHALQTTTIDTLAIASLFVDNWDTQAEVLAWIDSIEPPLWQVTVERREFLHSCIAMGYTTCVEWVFGIKLLHRVEQSHQWPDKSGI